MTPRASHPAAYPTHLASVALAADEQLLTGTLTRLLVTEGTGGAEHPTLAR